MHRLIVALLAAFDAAIAAAAGLAATLAPLTLLWVFGLGDGADWGALWPSGAKIWQFGHLVPLHIALPGEYLAVTGIDQSAAAFPVSLAPLAFATFTAIFAARSGARASSADAWITGVVTGSVVFAAGGALVALTSHTAVAEAQLWQALLFPALVFALPALTGALVTEWRDAGRGMIARLRDRTEAVSGGWGPVPGITVRAGSAAIAGLLGLGALALGIAVLTRAGQIVALYQAGNFDLMGAIVVTLTQFAYLPTFVVWGLSFVAGPGFALGTGTAVSPAATQVGVVPGVPVLGAVPETTTTWLLLLALLPIGVGALAGWIARSRFVATQRPSTPRPASAAPTSFPAAPTSFPADTGALDEDRRTALVGLLTPGGSGTTARIAPLETPAESTPPAPEPPVAPEPFLPRLVLTAAIAALAAGASALLAALASGAAGPGRLAAVGPQPGPVALAVGLEVALGAGILLLSGRRGERSREHEPDVSADASTPATPSPLPEDVAEPLPEHAPTPELGAAAALARWAAAQPSEASTPVASDEAVTPAVADAPLAPVAAPTPPAAAPIPPAPPATPAAAATADPDADTAPIPLPPQSPPPDQAMRPHQDDPGDSGL